MTTDTGTRTAAEAIEAAAAAAADTNPWTRENWNPGRQAGILRAKGHMAASAMAQAVGASVGGTCPEKSAKPQLNPFSRRGWNVTHQGFVARHYGMAEAERLAAAAGSRVGATRPLSEVDELSRITSRS